MGKTHSKEIFLFDGIIQLEKDAYFVWLYAILDCPLYAPAFIYAVYFLVCNFLTGYYFEFRFACLLYSNTIFTATDASNSSHAFSFLVSLK